MTWQLPKNEDEWAVYVSPSILSRFDKGSWKQNSDHVDQSNNNHVDGENYKDQKWLTLASAVLSKGIVEWLRGSHQSEGSKKGLKPFKSVYCFQNAQICLSPFKGIHLVCGELDQSALFALFYTFHVRHMLLWNKNGLFKNEQNKEAERRRDTTAQTDKSEKDWREYLRDFDISLRYWGLRFQAAN